MPAEYYVLTFITLILYQGIMCHPTPSAQSSDNMVGLRHYSNESMHLLHQLNLSTLVLAARDARIGGAILTYLRDRRNRTLWRKRQRQTNATAVSVPVAPVPQDIKQDSSEEDDDYEEYEDDYTDFDFSPASIFIYVLELFGTLIGLSWGAIATLFSAG